MYHKRFGGFVGLKGVAIMEDMVIRASVVVAGVVTGQHGVKGVHGSVHMVITSKCGPCVEAYIQGQHYYGVILAGIAWPCIVSG
jgi:hypothetical protein